MFNNVSPRETVFEKVYPFGKSLEFNIAIDPGSTETRSILWNPEEDEVLPDVNVEPSIFYKGSYDEDYSDVKIMNPMLSDCLEFKLSTLDSELFSFLKGSLAKQYGATSTLSSSVSKADQEATVVNIHSAITMNILDRLIKEQTDIPDNTYVKVKLTVALPPEDTDRGRVDIIKKKLSGVYRVEMPRIGKAFSYSINEKDTVIISECNASATYYGVVEDEDGDIINNEENVVIFEGGGRSSSFAVIKEGTLITRKDLNSNDVSGKKLKDYLAQIISESRGINRLGNMNAERALTQGYYRDGTEVVCIDDELDKAKRDFAKECIKPILQALDNAGISANEVQKIVFSGRLFKPTYNEHSNVVTPSLADYVISEFNSKANAKAARALIQKEYPIPEGLAIYRMGIE